MCPNFQVAALLLVLFATPWLHAQRRDGDDSASYERATETIPSSSPARLLNLNEGLAIIGAAMEMAHYRQLREDCSHFVHEIYERAGFPYTYENSETLYQGTGGFQRVTHPQPGDLIVWPGHMGIMVNPVQHSFFSSLRSGFGVEQYNSRYWRKRGHPRFYRYVKTESAGLTLATAKSPAGSAAALSQRRDVPPEPGLASPAESASAEPSLDGSLVPVVVSSEQATPDALRRALEEEFSDANARVANTDLLNSTKPVVIVESFQIKKVHVKHDQGWAEVRLNEPSSLANGEANLQRRSEKQRWPLYRNGKQWQLELPSDAIYVPKGTAVRLLAHQLATMTGRRTSPGNQTQQEAQLARLLDRLLGE